MKTNLIKKSLAFCKKHDSQIAFIFGVVGVVAAGVGACVASTKIKEVVADGKKEIETTKELYSDEVLAEEMADKKSETHKTYVKTLTKDYASLAWNVTKLYAGPVVLATFSIGALATSNKMLRTRNAQLIAAYTTLDTAFKRYRGNVKEIYGEEVDRNMRFGIKQEQVTTTETTKSGKEKTVTTKVETTNTVLDGYSDYAKFYCEGCDGWTKDPEYNLLTLKMREKEATHRLKTQGYLFLNDVYDMIGIERTQAGQVVGWIYDEDCPNGDNYVDFGIYDKLSTANQRFVNGLEPVILLDFNVDGVIINKI